MAAVYITKMYDRLDRIAYDYYGSSNEGQVERMLEENPRLAEYPIVLPIGVAIILPDPPKVEARPRVLKQVMLWD